MAIVQKFTYAWPEGKKSIQMNDWIKTLPQAAQLEYWESRRNGDRLRQVAIDEGRLVLRNGSYVWKDMDSFKIGKENDLVWEKYWRRWMDETGVIFTVDLIEE